MTFWDIISSEKVWTAAAGLAGAAAMAATDWRTPWRFMQHIFVGAAASAIATPVMFPAISALLGFIKVDSGSHGNAAAFITGAFAIYLFEYCLAFWRSRTEGQDDGR